MKRLLDVFRTLAYARGSVLIAGLLFPVLLVAERATPSIGFAGAPSDHGGQTCVSCHNSFAVNSDTRGSITVNVGDYTPNKPQLITINLKHPTAARVGFQITFRQVSDETKSAGTFVSADPIQGRCDDGTHFGAPQPCNGLKESAEHLNAPATIGGNFEFDVQWTPPSTEVGDLHVYVAVVAADGDGTASNDSVYTFTKTISAVGGCALNKKPTLQTALNGASFLAPLSSNSMISIFGLGFEVSGRTRTAGLGDFVNGGFPPALGCVSVQVTGPGIAQPVLLPIAYVQPDQINAQLPVFTGTGPVMMTVILNPGLPNELRSDLATLNTLQAFAPAFFTFNGKSVAALIAGGGTIVANTAVVASGRPAKPGELVSLFGTGFGATNPAVGPGQLANGAASITSPITVTIGAVTLGAQDVLYAGLSPGSISGLYQFNVRIPASTPDGDIPVSITIGGVQTQAGATIPVQH